MAYINKETSAKIRKALKAEFPNITFSVRIRHQCSLDVTITKSDIDFTDYIQGGEFSRDKGHRGVNPYHMNKAENPKHRKIFQKIIDIIKTEGEWFDKSDIMTDYFHTAFYIDLSVGTWCKPYVHQAPEATNKTVKVPLPVWTSADILDTAQHNGQYIEFDQAEAIESKAARNSFQTLPNFGLAQIEALITEAISKDPRNPNDNIPKASIRYAIKMTDA